MSVRALPPVDVRTATRLRWLPAMTRDALSGRWRGQGRRRFGLAALGVAYLVSPLDTVPELYTGLVGLVDDGLVAAFVAASVRAATDDYARHTRRANGPHDVRPSVHTPRSR